MSTNKSKNTKMAGNVAAAVRHLRSELQLSREKFGARVGCSLQTVVRWESGKAKVNYLNLARLSALAQDVDSVSARVFAKEMESYRDPLREVEEMSAFSSRIAVQLGELKAKLDDVQGLLNEGQAKTAALRLKKIRNELQSWIQALKLQTTANQE